MAIPVEVWWKKFFMKNFFENERLLIEVHQELARMGYNYDKTAVSHSLSDMVREGILTRVGTLRNYRYIQKKPLFEKWLLPCCEFFVHNII